MHTAIRITAVSVFVLALSFPTPQPSFGQEAEERRALYDDVGRFVYVNYFNIPWPKVDSLIQLNSIYNAVTEKGIEMGCFVDREFLIHQTGDEHNVVFKRYYEDWAGMTPGTGCTGRAYRAVVPDSAQRAAIDAGNQWVFGDAAHRDVIYWQPYPKR